MLSYALKMLIGDRAKYISIVVGLSFASFIITWQAAVLLGIVKRTYGFVTDTSQANIWVIDPTVQFIDDIKPLKDTDLYRVKSISGVDWAVPLYKGMISARLKNGTFQSCILVGIDDATFIGQPPKIVEGSLEDLRMTDGIIVSKIGAETKLASQPKNADEQSIPLRVGDTMELNDHRAVVVGLCEVSRTFQSQPIVYTTYNRATTFVPQQRKLLSFILVKNRSEISPEDLCRRIMAQTGLAAYTSDELKWLTIKYYFKNTGIFINFGTAILLGFIIGTAIAGQTLYNFTIDNLPYFGIFKAMGADNRLLVKMVILQALLVSGIGWGLGMGVASLFGYMARFTELSFVLPTSLYCLSCISVLLISLIAALICMRKVITIDPAIVFKS